MSTNKVGNPPKLYLSAGVSVRTGYCVSPDWKVTNLGEGRLGDGYLLVILDRANPMGAPHVNKTFEQGHNMLAAIDASLKGNAGDCIVIVMFKGHNFEWDQAFIEKFEEYGAGNVYRGLCQNAMLLGGSAQIASAFSYCLISIPVVSEQRGFEAGGNYYMYFQQNPPVTKNFQGAFVSTELVPIEVNGNTLYSLRLVDKK